MLILICILWFWTGPGPERAQYSAFNPDTYGNCKWTPKGYEASSGKHAACALTVHPDSHAFCDSELVLDWSPGACKLSSALGRELRSPYWFASGHHARFIIASRVLYFLKDWRPYYAHEKKESLKFFRHAVSFLFYNCFFAPSDALVGRRKELQHQSTCTMHI